MVNDLKRLAEDYFFGGKPLTDADRNALKSTHYRRILKDGGQFDALFESVYPDEEVDLVKDFNLRPGASHFYAHVDKRAINFLVDAIERKFNLGTGNPSHTKYEDVNIDALKAFIMQYAHNEMLDQSTVQHLKKITQNSQNDVYDILIALHSAGQ